MPAEETVDARAILAAAKSGGAAASRPSAAVDREDGIMKYDLGHLCAFDPSPIDEAELKAEGESAYLLRCARENAQLLTTQLYALYDGKGSIPLPPPVNRLPREKPLPVEKAKTRWEKFAESKGIVKKKRSKMVWDEDTQQWAPRWGYGRANNPKDDPQNWVIEAKPGDDGSVDPFEARDEKKKLKVDKKKRQEERNRLEAAHAASIGAGSGGGRGAAMSGNTKGVDKKEYLKGAIAAAQGSTASMGRFDKALKYEPSKTAGKRKHYDTGVGSAEQERDAQRTKSAVEKLFPSAGRHQGKIVNREVAAKKSKLASESKGGKGGGGKSGGAKGGKKGAKGKGKK